jgi:hypothetical protein
VARENSNRVELNRQSGRVAEERARVTTAVDNYFALLRQCVSDCGWTMDALAVEMGIEDKSLLWRMLRNERPWRPEHLVALPDDIEKMFAQRYAESFGLIVVVPVHGEQAARNFVSGLFGLLAHQLPVKASHMAKAEMAHARQEHIA